MDNILIEDYLKDLYPLEGENIAEDIAKLIQEFTLGANVADGDPRVQREFMEQDAILISYADQVLDVHRNPLDTFAEFVRENLKDVFTAVHLLPFYPSTSDDGFAVMDYTTLDPQIGDWTDISNLEEHFQVMFDAVINHVSSKHPWFQSFLNGDPEYENFFIVEAADFDTSNVVRPRATPLFHTYEGVGRGCRVWTTFSEDQIDLNFHNPKVLLACLRILLMYAKQGATIIRLDAVGYTWKETRTTCLNLPNAHVIVKLIRAVLNETYPNVALITETNVPHDQNVAYFGDGSNEAQLVYQFTLPPLVLYACLTGDASPLTKWASSLEFPLGSATFFNFLASHDGIGVMPARGYLSDVELNNMVETVAQRGGLVSVRSSKLGLVPYEINSTWYSALSHSDEPPATRIDKFIVSHAIALSFRGVPGIYFHSLFGTPNDKTGVYFTNHARTINRRKFRTSEFETVFNPPASVPAQVFAKITSLIHIRRQECLFSPKAEQRVLDLNDSVFGVIRAHLSDPARLLCLHNVTGETISVPVHASDVDMTGLVVATDLVTGEIEQVQNEWRVTLKPYGFAWLRLEENNA